jgi:hypothetical protein|tara:strand:- start:137 stop:325 length:189 start_codon:yes stop_codon:yes gene_type:complete
MKYKTSDHEKYVEEYDRLYELFEQDPQEAVYAVMDLERIINDQKQNIKAMADRLDELENVQG